MDYTALLASREVKDLRPEGDIILEGQYREAYDAMLDAHNAGLYVGLIGPVGAGSSARVLPGCAVGLEDRTLTATIAPTPMIAQNHHFL